MTHSTPRKTSGPTLWIIDPDQDCRRTLRDTAHAVGMTPQAYPSPQLFLESYTPSRPGCLVTEARLPAMSGLQVQECLLETDPTLPVIFLTSDRDVTSVVRAMKAGAVDYLCKPVSGSPLMDAIHQASAIGVARRSHVEACDETLKRMRSLTSRERQVMLLVGHDLASKDIAARLHLSVRTVEHHRRSFMEKMQARSVLDLARMLDRLHRPLTARCRAAAEALTHELAELGFPTAADAWSQLHTAGGHGLANPNAIVPETGALQRALAFSRGVNA